CCTVCSVEGLWCSHAGVLHCMLCGGSVVQACRSAASYALWRVCGAGMQKCCTVCSVEGLWCRHAGVLHCMLYGGS
ncbi:hypothetical protein NDU88_008918, partial [Pleurodeles waltl]